MMTFTLDPDVVERMKAWIGRQEPQPRQNAVVETALKRFLDEAETAVQIHKHTAKAP